MAKRKNNSRSGSLAMGNDSDTVTAGDAPPSERKTHLGWILSGGRHSAPNSSSFIATQSSDDTNHSTRLDDLVRQFWEVEHIFEPIARETKEELHCEEHFVNHQTRLPSGEYSVRLHMKRSLESLGDSYLQAKRRLESLERKFVSNPALHEKYSAFMNESLSLDHMSLGPKEDRHKCKYFLPHHCVIEEDSSTTKLRVVFDGCAATTSSLSLNDLLMSGPTIKAIYFTHSS
ncbi:GL15655 [Drosophila persimilis]|uniref:GL15655 n=1 Tax=Drosophila persimilis TaxID=7234 RepID=B4HA49_DROPE|nr:GL15655 [Drosophila persimilis]